MEFLSIHTHESLNFYNMLWIVRENFFKVQANENLRRRNTLATRLEFEDLHQDQKDEPMTFGV